MEDFAIVIPALTDTAFGGLTAWVAATAGIASVATGLVVVGMKQPGLIGRVLRSIFSNAGIK